MRVFAIISACMLAVTPVSVLAQSSVIAQLYRQLNTALSEGDYATVQSVARNLATLDTPRQRELESLATAIDTGDSLAPYLGALIESLQDTPWPEPPSASVPAQPAAQTQESSDSPATATLPNTRIVRVPFGRTGTPFTQGDLSVRIEGETQVGRLAELGVRAMLVHPEGCSDWASITFRAYDRFQMVHTWREQTVGFVGREWRVNSRIPGNFGSPEMSNYQFFRPDFIDVSEAECR